MNNNLLQKLILISALTTMFFAVYPDSVKPECFCYRHKESEAIMVGCEEFKPPNSSQKEIYCYSEDEEKMFIFRPDNSWKRIESDDPDCTPCEPHELKKIKDHKEEAEDLIRG